MLLSLIDYLGQNARLMTAIYTKLAADVPRQGLHRCTLQFSVFVGLPITLRSVS